MESVRIFTEKLPEYKKLLIVLDNAPWHKKAVRLMREDANYTRLEFLFLPPYSPESNPIERVWRITRRERTHNRFFENLQVLKTVLTQYFEKYKVPNKNL